MSVLIFKDNSIYLFLFLAVLDPHPCTGLALVSESGSHYPVAVHGPLTVVARAQALGAQTSAAATCGLSICSSWALKNRLNSCGTWA